MPEGSGLYFAIDTDAQNAQIEAADFLGLGLDEDPDEFKDWCGAFIVTDAGARAIGGPST